MPMLGELQFRVALDLKPVIEEYPALIFFPHHVGEAGCAMCGWYIECHGSPDGIEEWVNRDEQIIGCGGAAMMLLSGDENWGRPDAEPAIPARSPRRRTRRR